MDTNSLAKKKLVKHLLKRDPNLTEKDIPLQLNSIKRFVMVIQRLYTEPQAKITIKDFKKNGEMFHKKVISTDLEEFKKVFDKDKPRQGLIETFRKFHKSVTKDKYGR